MLSPRARNWLHRTGYVCTALVALELIGIAALAGYGLLQDHRQTAQRMAETATHAGTFRPGDRDILRALAFKSLHPLPALAALEGDGLRFIAEPQLGYQWYAVSLGGTGAEVQGVMIVTDRHGKEDKLTTRRFTMPRAAYAALTKKLDALSDGYSGYSAQCMDGLLIAFERVRGGRITSGLGNAGCSPHYREISTAMLQAMQAYAAQDVNGQSISADFWR